MPRTRWSSPLPTSRAPASSAPGRRCGTTPHPRQRPGGGSCVVGNATELKNVILLMTFRCPTTIMGIPSLGYKAHMGAGAITSNVKSDKSLVVIRDRRGPLSHRPQRWAPSWATWWSGLQRRPEPRNRHRPAQQHLSTSCVRGLIPENSIHKATGEVVPKR